MVFDSIPEVILWQKVSHHNVLCHLPIPHKLVDIILNDDVILDLERTVVHDGFDIMFF